MKFSSKLIILRNRTPINYHLFFVFPLDLLNPPEPPGFFPLPAFWISLVFNLFSKTFVLLFLSPSEDLGPPYFVSFHPCLDFLLLTQFYLARLVFLSSSTYPTCGMESFVFFFHCRYAFYPFFYLDILS